MATRFVNSYILELITENEAEDRLARNFAAYNDAVRVLPQHKRKFHTPEELDKALSEIDIEKDMEKIVQQRKAERVQKTLEKNLKKAQDSYDERIIKPAEELNKPKATSSLGDVDEFDEYTPEQRARLNAERKRIDKAVGTFQSTLSDAAKVADNPPVPYWQQVASRAGLLAKKLAKAAPVIGTGVSAYEAGTIGKSIYDAATDPNLSGRERVQSAMDTIRSNTLSGAAAGAMADLDTETQFTGPDGNPVDHSRMTPSELSAHNWRNIKRMSGGI